MPQFRNLWIAVASAIGAYWAAVEIEETVIRMVHPSPMQLTWVSDLLLAAAFGVVIYLQLNLKSARANLSHLEREHLAVEMELSLAAEIQRELLPASTGHCVGLAWAARLRQARKIGGDFYDFVELGPQEVLFLLCDISGKGIPAALLQSSTHTLFRMLVQSTRQPEDLVAQLSRLLYDEHRGNAFMTCFLGYLNSRERIMTFVNAGHPTGLLFQDGQARRLESCGPPAGILPNLQYSSETIHLKTGTIGLFVTDGITESLGAQGNWTQIATKAMASYESDPTPDELCRRLMDTVAASQTSLPFEDWEDDQTILAFVFTG